MARNGGGGKDQELVGEHLEREWETRTSRKVHSSGAEEMWFKAKAAETKL